MTRSLSAGVKPVRYSNVTRNAALALMLFLLVVAIDGAESGPARQVREYVVFVLTHELDYLPWLETVRERFDWPPALRLWRHSEPGGSSGSDEATFADGPAAAGGATGGAGR